jgi:hypothetical protein
VVAVWIEGSERLGQFKKCNTSKDRGIHGIRSYHRCYDALSYPLFFPKGELGWHMDIPKTDVSMEEVNTTRALRKARTDGIEDDSGSFFVFYFSCRLLHLC